ncbi:hypothetical protein M406DRAFT_69893 [Cryphonectria parasitica EP155]|uniref:Uncharacterized protein n=1 Tax=Cryphonectria parasitica (strain ATCC 38755 / EP155) TaxID=660469 RepID=A0A9P5CRQ7_CRYP1|nr:uncharacterized protein M406DRAFT_69893 [Cryphonectria parasitica EP155]KAF3767777.1 hypothetical protein M406DRAFT_69893 [Cryphonectria parasitica EP155]
MAAKSPVSPTIMEDPKEDSSASDAPIIDMEKQLNNLSIASGSPAKKNISLSSPALTIQPVPYYNIQSPMFSPPPALSSSSYERSYLLENLQRQHARGERLTHALYNLEIRLTSAHSKGQAKNMRREAKVLRGNIAESHKQEQLILLRLNDLHNQDLSRGGFYQPQSAAVLAPYSVAWSPYSPWAPMTLPPVLPADPVSPLTPLPPGLYHPAPIAPSPLASPYWLGAQYPVANSFVPNDPSFYLGVNFQPPYIPEGAFAAPSRRTSSMATVTGDSGPKHKVTKSVDFTALPQRKAYHGRRWSLADAFSPEPKDKRMSMPGLQTIWKDQKPEEE